MAQESSDGRHVDPLVDELGRNRVPKSAGCEVCRGPHMAVVELSSKRARIEHPAGCPCQCTIERYPMLLATLMRKLQESDSARLAGEWNNLPLTREPEKF